MAAALVSGALVATARDAHADVLHAEGLAARARQDLRDAERTQAALQGAENHARTAQLGQLRTAAMAEYVADLAARAGAARTAADAALASSVALADETTRAALTQALAALGAAGQDLPAQRVALDHVDTATTAVTLQVDTARARAAQAHAQPATPPASVAAETGAPAPSIQDVGEATLRSLPGNAGVHLSWNDPGLGGHLGGVYEGDTTTIMVNATRLAGNPSKTRDVIRHELAHVLQGRLMTSTGLSWDQIKAAQTPAFGDNASEKIADCVARHFGATWTYYTSDCASADKQAWVSALIAGHMP